MSTSIWNWLKICIDIIYIIHTCSTFIYLQAAQMLRHRLSLVGYEQWSRAEDFKRHMRDWQSLLVNLSPPHDLVCLWALAWNLRRSRFSPSSWDWTCLIHFPRFRAGHLWIPCFRHIALRVVVPQPSRAAASCRAALLTEIYLLLWALVGCKQHAWKCCSKARQTNRFMASTCMKKPCFLVRSTIQFPLPPPLLLPTNHGNAEWMLSKFIMSFLRPSFCSSMEKWHSLNSLHPF